MLTELKKKVRENGIKGIRVQKSGCLDFCENGPTCVIYPEGKWFKITEESIPKLIDFLEGGKLPSEHLLDLKA